MATPEKTSSISFSETTLSDSDLPITTFTKSELVTWLNSITGPDVAVFFGSTTDANPNMRLILAEKTASGIRSTGQKESAPLPCLPHCKE